MSHRDPGKRKTKSLDKQLKKTCRYTYSGPSICMAFGVFGDWSLVCTWHLTLQNLELEPFIWMVPEHFSVTGIVEPPMFMWVTLCLILQLFPWSIDGYIQSIGATDQKTKGQGHTGLLASMCVSLWFYILDVWFKSWSEGLQEVSMFRSYTASNTEVTLLTPGRRCS